MQTGGVATSHLLHPPSDGVQYDKLLTAAMPDEWEAYEKAVKEESEGGKTPGKDTGDGDGSKAEGGKTPGKDTKEDVEGDGDGSTGLSEKAKVQASADERASSVLAFDPGLAIVSPDTWSKDALAAMMNCQVSWSHGAFCCFFRPQVRRGCSSASKAKYILAISPCQLGASAVVLYGGRFHHAAQARFCGHL